MLKVITLPEAEAIIENKTFDYVKFDNDIDNLIKDEPQQIRRCIIDEKFVLYGINAEYIEMLYNFIYNVSK